MEQVLLCAASLAATLYCIFSLVRGVPESLSATYYSLGDKGWIFQTVMALIAACLMPAWMEASEEGYECLPFLGCSSLLFVAAAPCFRMELEGRVHYAAAVVCCASVFLWQILEGLWDVTLWFVWVCGMLALSDRSKWCWWLEVAAVGSLLANLWRII